jgi:hypothetical protein
MSTIKQAATTPRAQNRIHFMAHKSIGCAIEDGMNVRGQTYDINNEQ